MFCFVLLMIAATNLALGYAVAMHFGFGPKSIADVDAAHARAVAAVPTFSIQGGDGDETPIDELLPAEPLAAETPRDAAATTEVPASAEPNDADENKEDDAPITQAEVTQLAAEMAETTEEIADSDEQVADDAQEAATDQPPIAHETDEPHDDQAAAIIEGCLDSLGSYRRHVVEIDAQIRTHEDDADAPIAESLDAMETANRHYLEEQEERLADLVGCGGVPPELAPSQQAAVDAVEVQCEKVRESQESLQSIKPDATEALGAICAETRKLASASDVMRDRLNAALRAAASKRDATSDNDRTPETDPLTGLLARTAFDRAVERIWQDDPEAKQPLSVVLVDIDRFESFNVAHGPHAGDLALRAVADMVQSEVSSHDVAARYSGQQMAVLCSDTEGRGATQMAERMRQTIAAAVMLVGDHEEKITVSCAAAERSKDASPETLLKHTLTALAEAKRYGRNRTFISEGKHATPVVPPSLDVKETRIVLRAMAEPAELET